MPLRPRTALNLAIWSYTGLHLLIAGALPLAAHEAHYAVYARNLQLSYLDHPPLAAWLQSLVLHFSSADFAMRLLPIGLSVAAQYLVARLARTCFPLASPWLELICVLLLQGTLVFHGSMTLSPDVPLIPLGLLVVLLSFRALEQDALRDWLLLGLAIGLAGLSKYTAVMLAVSLVIVLLARRGWRALFAPRLWLAGVIALLVVSPVFWWNYQHDWATIRFHSDYQFEDVERWSLIDFLASTAGQFLYYSPLLVAGGLAALWQLGRSKPASVRRDVVLALFAVPTLLVYLVTALESRASPHWSVLGWLLLIPLLGHLIISRWRSSRPLRVLAWTSGSYSAAILLALPLLAVPIGTWPDYTHPSRLVTGWEAAARHGDQLRQTLDPAGFEGPPVLLVRNWHHAGLLAWYLPDVPVLNLFHDINPHNMRVGLSDHRTWGVLVNPRSSSEPRRKDLTRDFNCEPIDAQPAYFGDSLVQTFHFYACYSKLPDPNTDPEAR